MIQKAKEIKNKIKKQWEKLSKREKIILVTLIVCLPLTLYFKFYFFPKKREIKILEQKRERLERKIIKLKKLKKKERILEAKNKKIKKILKIAKQILPNKTEIADLLNKMAEEQKRFGIEISEFRAKQERIKENFYAEIPLELEIKGEYNNIMLFLDNIRKKERILNPYSLNINKQKERLDANAEIMTYRLLTKEERKELRKKKK